MNRSILIIGHGSIGKLHAEVFKSLACDVAVVTGQSIDTYPSYPSLPEALAARSWWGVVVASPTSLHAAALETLQQHGFKGRVLVEKPMLSELAEVPAALAEQVAVGYNLRFHPLLLRLRDELKGQRVITVSSYVGQYLPSWRPARDYRESYSAKREEGGGVLRDLSHELDFLRWLFGAPTRLVAMGGHYSSLELDVEDSVSILMKTESVAKLTVELNYLDRPVSRFIRVHGDLHSWHLDFIKGALTRDGLEIATAALKRTTTYESQARAWLDGDASVIASCSDGLAVVSLFECIEQSLTQSQWMNL